MRTTIDETRLAEFMGKALTDLAAAESAAVAYVGDRLGLYRALAGADSMTASELATATGTNERLVLEWLGNQTAGGYVEHSAGRFSLPAEHALALADSGSPVYIAGVFEIIASMWADTGRIEAAFRGDGGVAWGEHDERLYSGVERFFTPAYRANLVSTWLPALDGVTDRLQAGARVADVGAGYGVSTTLLAEAFPASTFVGYDVHAESVEEARRTAKEAGMDDRVQFEVTDAVDLPAGSFDLVCFFDAFHDMGNPVAVATAARNALTEGGTLMLVEPLSRDSLEDNINPVSQLYYAGSTFLCTPSALAQGDHALGAQAGPSAVIDVLHQAGFKHARVAIETPFNLVFEAR